MFEEVKEMIDSTIYTNGRGEVTAQNINLAMHGMVDATEEKFDEVDDAVKAVEDKVTALEENGTGGDVAYVYVPFDNQLSDAQIEENKKSYVKILNGADLKSNVMGAIGNAEFYRIESGAIIFGVVVHGTTEGSSGARIYHESLQCILSNDGTVIVDAFNDCNIPAPSGPLYLNGDSSHDQDVYNVVFNALSNTEPCPQILMMDSGICASIITVWLDNNLVQNGVAISFYIPTDGGYVTFILSPDGSMTPQAA